MDGRSRVGFFVCSPHTRVHANCGKLKGTWEGLLERDGLRSLLSMWAGREGRT